MKIQILTQNLKRPDILEKGLGIAKSLAYQIGIDFQYTIKETSKKFSTQSWEVEALFENNEKRKITRTCINAQEILDEADSGFRTVCLIYNPDNYTPHPTNPFQHALLKDNFTTPTQIPEDWFVDYEHGAVEGFAQVCADFILHENGCHAGFFLRDGHSQNDITHNRYSYDEWRQKQPSEWYLFLMKQLKAALEAGSTSVSYTTIMFKSTNKKLVKELQTLLNTFGAKLVVDGDFGAKTLKAVKDFQLSKGLKPDGIVGNKTWTELKKKD